MRASEIIAEIEDSPSREEPIGERLRHFTNSQIIGKFDNIVVRLSGDFDIFHYGAFINDRLVAYLSSHEMPFGRQILFTLTDPDHRNRGLMRRLIKIAIDLHGPLFSDSLQTAEAQHMWKALIRSPGDFRIHVYDTDTGKRHRPSDVDPWDGSENRILVAEERIPTNYERLREDRRSKHGFSDPDWYAPGSSNWFNP